MRIFNATVGFMLLGLAVLHGFIPKSPLLSVIYAAGAVMALVSLWRNISFGTARVFAFLTVAAMFFYFAAFFRIVDHFHENWYRGGDGFGSGRHVAFGVRNDPRTVSVQLPYESRLR